MFESVKEEEKFKEIPWGCVQNDDYFNYESLKSRFVNMFSLPSCLCPASMSQWFVILCLVEIQCNVALEIHLAT